MKILAFTDMHGNKNALRKIIKRSKKEDIDLIVCAGDFTIFSGGVDEILSRLNKIGKPVLLIHGNHEDDSDLRRICGKMKNCHFIHNKVFRIKEYVFIGWGGGGFSYIDRGLEKKISKFKKIGKNKKVIVVTHAPPYKTKIDKIYKEYAGNKTIRKLIESVKPILAISGHLHECVGEDKIGKTKVINPGYRGKVISI